MEDGEIVMLYLARKEQAIEKTKEKYGKRLREIALRVVGDAQTAAECENDVYLSVWRTVPPQDPRSYLYAYLARITRHIALNRCRAAHALSRCAPIQTLSAELEECIAAPDDTACRVEDMALAEAINGFLKTQPEKARNVFVRRYFYCDDISAIAARYSMTKSGVKTTLFRSRNALRAYLEKEGYSI